MSIMLPGDLAWVLNLLGFNWPNIDEDELRAAAAGHRQMAARVEQAASDGSGGAGAVTGANQGRSVQAFASRWGRVSATHLDRLARVYRITADVQDAMADIVEVAKGLVIAQLVELAAEIAAAAAASIVTFGLSDAAGLAATAVTRITVREILDELERQLISTAEQLAAGEAMQALSASVGNLISQEVADYLGTGHGLSVGDAGHAGVSAAGQGASWLGSGSGASAMGTGVGVGTAAELLRHGGE